MPDGRPDLPVNIFEFVQVAQRRPVELDRKLPRRLETVGINKRQDVRAVAQDKRLAVIGQTPALGIVFKLAKLREAVPIIDKAAMRLPGQLDQPVVDHRQTLAEILRIDIDLLQYLSRSVLHSPQRLSTELPSALKKAVVPHQPL